MCKHCPDQILPTCMSLFILLWLCLYTHVHTVVDPKMAPQNISTYEPVHVTLLGKRVFANVIKDLETRWSWVIPLCPESDGKCPYEEKHREIWDRQMRRHVQRKRPCEDGAERCCHKPRNTNSHQKLEEVKNGSAPTEMGGVQPCQHLELGLLASRTVRE